MPRQRGERNNYTPDYTDEDNSDQTSAKWKNSRPEYRTETTMENFQEALDRMASDKDYSGFKQKIADDFRNDKNIMEYSKEERAEYVKTYIEAFNDMDHPNFRARTEAAKDISQNTFKHFYDQAEKVEADNSEKIPKNVRKALEKEGITDYKLNEQSGNIEFDFKDLEQLKRISKKTGRKINVMQKEEDHEVKDSTQAKDDTPGKPANTAEQFKPEEHTAYLPEQQDNTKSDEERRRELKIAMDKFKDGLLWSEKNEQQAIERMEFALNKGTQFVDMPAEELAKQNDFENVSKLEEDDAEHRIEENINMNWQQVYDAIADNDDFSDTDKRALRLASDALKDAYQEDLSARYDESMEPGAEDTYHAAHEGMTEASEHLADAIRNDHSLSDQASADRADQADFPNDPRETMDELEQVHDQASQYLQAADPEATLTNMQDEAIRKLVGQLEEGIDGLRQHLEAEMAGDDYDGPDYQTLQQETQDRARALQYMMADRQQAQPQADPSEEQTEQEQQAAD